MQKRMLLLTSLTLTALFLLSSCGKKSEETAPSSEADMTTAQKVLSMMDTDKNKMVSEEEFKAHFHVKDLDKDGFISKEEMRKHHIEVHGNDTLFEKRFSKTDAGGDGKVDEEECMAKFKKLDANGDGSITEDEFQKMIEANTAEGTSVQ